MIYFLSFYLQISPNEIRELIAKYNNTDQLAQSGVTVAGTKYMYLSSTDKVIRAKKGTSGVHAIKTNQSKFLRFDVNLEFQAPFYNSSDFYLPPPIIFIFDTLTF